MTLDLKNAPSTVQRLMNYILRNLISKECLIYLDDIIIPCSSLEEHCQNIEKVIKELHEANLKMQLVKGEFLREKIQCLGYIVSPEGVKPQPNKIYANKNFPISKIQQKK